MRWFFKGGRNENKEGIEMILICNRCMLAYYRHGRGGERRFLKSFRIPPENSFVWKWKRKRYVAEGEVSTTFWANWGQFTIKPLDKTYLFFLCFNIYLTPIHNSEFQTVCSQYKSILFDLVVIDVYPTFNVSFTIHVVDLLSPRGHKRSSEVIWVQTFINTF